MPHIVWALVSALEICRHCFGAYLCIVLNLLHMSRSIRCIFCQISPRSVQVVFTKLAESSWRTLLFWIGPPGLVIAGLSLLTLAEPRSSNANAVTSLVNAFKPKQKPRIAAEDMVTATQYSRVRPSQPCMPPASHPEKRLHTIQSWHFPSGISHSVPSMVHAAVSEAHAVLNTHSHLVTEHH